MIAMNSFCHKPSWQVNSSVSSRFEVWILWVLIFLPQASFDIFYLFTFLLLVPLFFSRKKMGNFELVNTVIIFSCVYFLLFIKFILYENILDFKELTKIILCYFVYKSFKTVTISVFEKVLLVFIFLNACVSLLQFFHIDLNIISIVSDIYHSQKHAEFSFSKNSVRSLGFSPGPGQHGILAIFTLIFFLILFTYDKTNLSRLAGVALSFTSLILSQSKTSILVFLIVGSLFTILVFKHKNYSAKFVVTIGIAVLCFIVFINWEQILSSFYDINRLVNMGLNTSSVQHRLFLWEEKFSAMFESNVIFMLFGVGRSYLEFNNIHNTSFDNDYLYFLINYGFVGLLLFLFFIIRYSIMPLFKFKSLLVIDKIICCVVFAGSLCSLGLAFFIDLKIILMLGILFSISKQKKNNRVGMF